MAITPTGQALSMLVLCLVLLSIAWVIMGLRLMVRTWIKGLGVDDYLMCIGHLFFTLVGIALVVCAYHGVGSHADVEGLTLYDIIQAHKWFMLAQLFYSVSTVFIKSSICFAMLRITTRKIYVWIIYAVIVLTAIASLAVLITVLTICRPIAASYDPTVKGECGSPSTIITASYFISAVSILTDWTCAILPAFIVWEVQLSTRVKVSVAFVLGLGVFASSATLVRLPYLLAYNDPTDPDYLYKIAVLAIWSIVELGIAIIAASLATLRPLLKYVPFMGSTSSNTAKSAHTGLEGGGGKSRGGAHAMHPITSPGRNETTIQGGQNANWQQLSDSDSQKFILGDDNGITVTRQVKQKTVAVSTKEARSHDDDSSRSY